MSTAYDPNSLYQGVITEQGLYSTKDDDPQLRLTVLLTHKLRGKTEAEGLDELEESLQLLKTIYFNFKPDPTQLERNFRDLRPLGLVTQNIETLDLDHPKALSMIDKRVVLKARYTEDARTPGLKKDWWNIVNPVARAPKISMDAITKFKLNNSSALASAFESSSTPKADKMSF